jgi:hypothetical protein
MTTRGNPDLCLELKGLGTRLHFSQQSTMADSEQKASARADYDLYRPIDTEHGPRQGLTSYGDAHFSLFLRKVFIKAAGYRMMLCHG